MDIAIARGTEILARGGRHGYRVKSPILTAAGI